MFPSFLRGYLPIGETTGTQEMGAYSSGHMGRDVYAHLQNNYHLDLKESLKERGKKGRVSALKKMGSGHAATLYHK